jgi:hypothetical protein
MAVSWRRLRPGAPTTLAVVAALFLGAQLLLVREVPLGWDESIYASQTDPRRPALSFTAPRARGTSWLAAPVQAVSGSPVVLRTWLALCSSALLLASYAVWLRTPLRASVSVAAVGLASLWVTIFYAPSLMPNVAVAPCGVLATGAVVAALTGGWRWWHPWAAGAALAAATAVRPGDVVPVAGALGCLALLPLARERRTALVTAVVAGVAVGALPWVVEAQVRYGGLLARLRRAVSTQSTGERFVPDYQLRAVDGPLLCRPCSRDSQPVQPAALLMWAVGVALVVVAVVVVLRAGERLEAVAVVVPAVVGVACALPYLLLVGYAAPRFLLPAYALLVLPAASGLAWVVRRRRPGARLALQAAVAVGFAGHLVVQHDWLEDARSSNERNDARWSAVATVLADHGVTPPCTLTGSSAAPVAYRAGCDHVRVAAIPGDEPYTAADLGEAVRTTAVAHVLRGAEPVPGHARPWKPVRDPGLPRGWRVRLAPAPAEP